MGKKGKQGNQKTTPFCWPNDGRRTKQKDEVFNEGERVFVCYGNKEIEVLFGLKKDEKKKKKGKRKRQL